MLSPYVDLLLNQTISLAGHFTRKDRIQVIAVPIIVASKDLTTPAPIIIYTAPEHPLNAPVDNDSKGWESEVPFPDTFVLIHEVTGTLPPTTRLELFHDANLDAVIHVSGGFDAVLLSGRDGINTIWFNELEQQWVVAKVNDGLPQDGCERLGFLTDPDLALTGVPANPYWGSGSCTCISLQRLTQGTD